jgi:cytochrome c biogenesis protein CcmG/thiol:disulfide interchange protein DsbE
VVSDDADRGGAAPGPPRDRKAEIRRLRRLVAAGVLALVVALAGVAGAIATRGHGAGDGAVLPPPSYALGPGDRAPIDFDVARLGGGARIALGRLAAGRPTVVNFFASWCTACSAELDAFGAVWHDDRARVAFVGIDENDPDGAKALALLRAADAGYPVGIDPASDELSSAFGVAHLPTTFFIDATGRVRFEVVGRESEAALTTRIAALVDGRTPTG